MGLILYRKEDIDPRNGSMTVESLAYRRVVPTRCFKLTPSVIGHLVAGQIFAPLLRHRAPSCKKYIAGISRDINTSFQIVITWQSVIQFIISSELCNLGSNCRLKVVPGIAPFGHVIGAVRLYTFDILRRTYLTTEKRWKSFCCNYFDVWLIFSLFGLDYGLD